jgi:phosphoglucomutase/phosphomannomutase
LTLSEAPSYTTCCPHHRTGIDSTGRISVADWTTLEPAIRDGFSAIQVSPDLRQTALDNLKKWFADAALAATRPQLEFLVESGNFAALFDAFFRQIPFGTGGRRGGVGFGPNRINHHTVETSAQGHADYLKRRFPDRDDLKVVLAYDVRIFNNLRGVYDPARANPLLGMTSRDFARIAARVYGANGIGVWFPNPDSSRFLSTPELSFSIRRLGADGGMNVSASHNHPDDNGAKIYNGEGSQETPPLDEEIATIIEATGSARSVEWEAAVGDGRIRWIPDEVHTAYIDANLRASLDPEARSARVVFTPLHGTGWDSVGTTLQRAGFDVRSVPGQDRPDGTFPEAPFRSPNPEVPESLHRATELAREIDADLVLGADPDADRLGMVVADPDRGWTFVPGNEIGALLAAYILSATSRTRRRPFAATTIVTSNLFRRITEAHGVPTLSDLPVGFKYIAAMMNGIERDGRWGGIEASIDDFVLGFEESYGYLVIPEVRDKDAAGAALLLAELVSRLKNDGRTVLGYLDAIHRRYGYVRNLLRSTVMRGARGFFDMQKIQRSLRESPPAAIGPLRVVRFVDRCDESGPYGKILSETDRTARDILIFELERGSRVILRPSGTEPKNKIYVEACGEPLGDDIDPETWDRHRREIDDQARLVAVDFAREMLARIGVEIPGWALEVSDLVSLEDKRDFAASFMPELVGRIGAGESGPDFEAWIDDRLRGYGPDARLLVRPGVAAWGRDEAPEAGLRARLSELFDLD